MFHSQIHALVGTRQGAAVGVIIPCMPALATDLGIGPAEYGIVIGSLALTKLLGNIPASNAADKHGRKSIIVKGLLVMAGANVRDAPVMVPGGLFSLAKAFIINYLFTFFLSRLCSL